jgi:hypothetical protein
MAADLVVAEEKRSVAAFLQKHEGMLYTVARKVLRRLHGIGVSSEFDDVRQELITVMIVAQRKFDPSRGIAFSTYFYRAAFNEMNRRFASQIEERELGVCSVEELMPDDSDGDLLECIDSGTLSPEELWTRRMGVRQALRTLSPLASLMLRWMLAPSAALQREICAEEAHANYARTQGQRARVATDLQLICRLMTRMGVPAGRVRAAHEELLRLSDSLNQ